MQEINISILNIENVSLLQVNHRVVSLQNAFANLMHCYINGVLVFNFQGKFFSSPTVFATAEHYRSSMKHDAAPLWLEDLSASFFKICIRELQNFAGVHDDISVVSRCLVISL